MILTKPQPTATSTKWGADEAASLEKGLATLGLIASPLQLSSLHSYAALLLKWNRTYNLLGADDAQTLLDEHLLDSLATLPPLQRWLPAATPEERPRLLDIGAGAGLPGIVLAMMLPQLPVTLVEPIGKKAAFMRQAIAHCRLENTDVFEGRIDAFPGAIIICSRSTTTLTYDRTTAKISKNHSLSVRHGRGIVSAHF